MPLASEGAPRTSQLWLPLARTPASMRGAPHRGLATLILRISSITSLDTEGRHSGWRLLQLQYSRNLRRCHAITVSDLTITSADRQPLQIRDSQTQNTRLAILSRSL